MEEILLTPLAASLFVKRGTGSIRSYALSGRLPCIVTSTGRRLFRKSDLEALKAELMESRREPTEAA